MIKDFFNKLFTPKSQSHNDLDKTEDSLSTTAKPIQTMATSRVVDTYSILERIEKYKEFEYIPDAFWFFLRNNDDLKVHTVQILSKALTESSISTLPRIDLLFRERSSIDWSYNWGAESPKVLLSDKMTTDEKITVLGLATFHPNGYFREKSIKLLSEIGNGSEMTYLLIRLNDWVEPIRILALKEVCNRLTPENTHNIVRNLPIIYRLENCGRGKHKDFIDKAISFLSRKESIEGLILGIKSKDISIRRACFRILSQNRLIDNQMLLKYLFDEPVSHIRVSVLRLIANTITNDEFIAFKDKFLEDKFASIRILAYELYNKYFPNESIGLLEKALTDKHCAVRETSRYLLKKHGQYDFRCHYIKMLDSKDDCYGAIAGIGEVGKHEDARYISKYLKFDSARIVRLTMKSLNKICGIDYINEFIGLLNDERYGVSKEARIILSGHLNCFDESKVYSLFKESSLEHVVKNSALLLCSLSKWSAIRYIIEICSSGDECLSQMGRYSLNRWKFKYNRSFSVPTKIQVTALMEAINQYSSYIDKKDIEWIDFVLNTHIKK